MATIADVARATGLSKGTVSRALNDYTTIAPATKATVREAARALGYQPSHSARNLKRGASETIGVVLTVGESTLYSPFLAAFLSGVTQRLNELSYDLLVSTALSDDQAALAYRRMVAAKKADGFIVTRTLIRDPRIECLTELGVPFIAHGRTIGQDGHAWFDLDNERAMRDAVAHVASLGHRRIGYVGAPADLNFARLRLAGFVAGLRDAGCPADDALVAADAGYEELAGERAALALLRAPEPPTAIVCAVDRLAIGAAVACASLGLEVGRHVTLIGYDDIPSARHVSPPLTTFSQDMAASGARVASDLVRLINGAEPGEVQTLARATLVRRASDGPPALDPAALAARIEKAGAAA